MTDVLKVKILRSMWITKISHIYIF